MPNPNPNYWLLANGCWLIYPMWLFNQKLAGLGLLPTPHDEGVGRHILADDVERQAGRFEKPKTVPLALGKEPNAVVLTDDFAFRVDYRTDLRRQVLAEELRDRHWPDETDSHALFSGVIW